MFCSYGTLNYRTDGSLIVEIDQELVRYYRYYLARKAFAYPQKHQAHISVVRKETLPVRMEMWEKYQGKTVPFFVQHKIWECERYFWVNVYSFELERIRLELGLDLKVYNIKPIAPFNKCFHFTIGNKKEKQKNE